MPLVASIRYTDDDTGELNVLTLKSIASSTINVLSLAVDFTNVLGLMDKQYLVSYVIEVPDPLAGTIWKTSNVAVEGVLNFGLYP